MKWSAILFYLFTVRTYLENRVAVNDGAATERSYMEVSTRYANGFLNEYEQDYQTGMDVVEIAEMIYSYTSGYPYLVSCLCKMIDEDIPCEDILSQINVAKSALHKAGQVVLEGHIKHCVRDGLEHGDPDKTIENFTKAVERFANMS